ncbi:MAG: hypothetical protein LBB54_01675, partial [Cellulomonadaceae bacterium]|nr:hypothetical protein [Cellulomonadaceae bacterium]
AGADGAQGAQGVQGVSGSLAGGYFYQSGGTGTTSGGTNGNGTYGTGVLPLFYTGSTYSSAGAPAPTLSGNGVTLSQGVWVITYTVQGDAIDGSGGITWMQASLSTSTSSGNTVLGSKTWTFQPPANNTITQMTRSITLTVPSGGQTFYIWMDPTSGTSNTIYVDPSQTGTTSPSNVNVVWSMNVTRVQ